MVGARSILTTAPGSGIRAISDYYRSLAEIFTRKIQGERSGCGRRAFLKCKIPGRNYRLYERPGNWPDGNAGGKIDQSTLANPYPHEASFDSTEKPIPQTKEWPGRIYGASDASVHVNYDLNSQEKVDRFKSRARLLDIKISAAALKKGVNVLSLEIHRAPADPMMFTSLDLTGGNNGNIGLCWNRASVEDIQLTATASESAIESNIARPEGVQVGRKM